MLPDIVDNSALSFNPFASVSDPVERTYRDALGDGLEEVLDGGVDTLDALVEGLNARGVTARAGTPWTAAALAAELRRLAP